MKCPFLLIPLVCMALMVASPGVTGQQLTPDQQKEQERQLRAWAERGDADAQFELGLQFLTGANLPQNQEEGVKWLEKAANQGHLKAQHVYGSLFEDGLGVEQDSAKAAEWYLKAAEGGLAMAQHAIAVAYEIGRGVEKDTAKAAQWFQRAAGQNYPPSMTAFASKLEKGEGVEKDAARAALLNLKAAKLDFTPAMSRLAYQYYKGSGLPVDYRRSFGWYQRAAKSGDPWAVNDLAWFLAVCPDEDMHNGEQAVLIAKEALRIMAENGDDHRFEMLDTVAAAYARNGEFVEAVLWQKRAIELMEEQAKENESGQSREELEQEFNERLQLYESRTPYSDPEAAGDPEAQPLPLDTILQDEGIPEAPPKKKPSPSRKGRGTVV
jgi:TPR repeat protein